MARRLTGENTISWRDPTSPDQALTTGASTSTLPRRAVLMSADRTDNRRARAS